MSRDRVPKVCGADIELGNFIEGWSGSGTSGRIASRLLLHAIPAGYICHEAGSAQDSARRYLATNGGCAYIDLDHLELCVPEVIDAWDHVAAWHAMLRIARDALLAVNRRLLPSGKTIHLLANNSDGEGHTYGSHVSMLVTRAAWDNLFERKLHHLLYLASFLVSSIVFTGAGKVGAENGQPDVDFQLAQRADFFEVLTGVQTTYRRPIVNSRDEPLCGTWQAERSAALARLHCIFFDNTLCHGSTLLKIGTLQLLLALLEAERLDPALLLDDPVGAVVRWSHDPTLRHCERTASGRAITAVELQLGHLEMAERFAAEGGFEGMVPRAPELLALWRDTLEKLRTGNLDALAGRIDWILKRRALEQARASHPELAWASPELKYLDHTYSSLCPERGLFWAWERLGVVETLVGDAEIHRFEHEPPADTRAFVRAMLLRRAAAETITGMDWDFLRFAVDTGWRYARATRTVELPDPLGPPRAAVEAALTHPEFDDVLDALGASPPTSTMPTTCYPMIRN